MREDMFKVIVERPRSGGGVAKGRHSTGEPDEDSAQREALHKHRRTKFLNENLRPLERYLQAQVGRPWDRVYSEICDRIDVRSTVQQHIRQHIGDFVAMDVVVIGTDLFHVGRGWTAPEPLASRYAPRLYVDPRTRLLRVNQHRHKEVRAWQQRDSFRDEDRRVLDGETELQRVGGCWYEVRFRAARGEDVERFKVLPARQAKRSSRAACDARIACAKRQLGRDELRHYGLDNE